jgi:hypothetical protein
MMASTITFSQEAARSAAPKLLGSQNLHYTARSLLTDAADVLLTVLLVELQGSRGLASRRLGIGGT